MLRALRGFGGTGMFLKLTGQEKGKLVEYLLMVLGVVL